MGKPSTDRHREPLTGIRFPADLKKDLHAVAVKHGTTMNKVVVSGTRTKVEELKKKETVV